MSYDLLGPRRKKLGNSVPHWPLVLDLAKEHGWHPTGTKYVHWSMPVPVPGVTPDEQLRRIEADWDGNYVTNDGQAVEGDDCADLLSALLAAQHAMSNGNVAPDTITEQFLEDDDMRRSLAVVSEACGMGEFYIL